MTTQRADRNFAVMDEAARKICPRFRVLIIGKANAGKTTISQKVCNTTETPTVYDRNGHKINPSTLAGPSRDRGVHDIENEIRYESHPGFVFHDSRGFEAGGIEEVEAVINFINRLSAKAKLSDRLHVIWFCLPMDNSRPLCPAEMEFFERGTGVVPVIAVFTKYDALISTAYQELRTRGKSIEEAKRGAPTLAGEWFEAKYLKVLFSSNVKHRPRAHVHLKHMNKPDTDCGDLTQATADALDNFTLRRLFITMQQNRFDLKSREIIISIVIPKVFATEALEVQDFVPPVVRRILGAFFLMFLPNRDFFNNNLFNNFDLNDIDFDDFRRDDRIRINDIFRRLYPGIEDVIGWFCSIASEMAGPPPPFYAALSATAATLIIAQHSFSSYSQTKSIAKADDIKACLEQSIVLYRGFECSTTVRAAVERTFAEESTRFNNEGDGARCLENVEWDKEKLAEKLYKLVLENSLSKDYVDTIKTQHDLIKPPSAPAPDTPSSAPSTSNTQQQSEQLLNPESQSERPMNLAPQPQPPSNSELQPQQRVGRRKRDWVKGLFRRTPT